MRSNRFYSAHFANAIGLILLSVLSVRSMAQTAAIPAASQVQALGLECNGARILDPFKGKLAGPALPPEVLASAIANKDSILKSGLPCQENVGTGAQADPAGVEASGLENLQRGFDFYSWRTFLALNAPADASAPRATSGMAG